MKNKYFEYNVTNIFSKHTRCLKVILVDCSKEKAIENANKFKKLTNLIDSVWDEYGKSKKTRHGREYTIQ